MQPLAEAGGVTLEVEGECVAFADPDILDQVMVGLVGNAIKHTPEDGKIRLSAIEHEDGRCDRRSPTAGTGFPPRRSRASSTVSSTGTGAAARAASVSAWASAASTSWR